MCGDHRAMSREFPSGTVTFVFTDIEGSTRLLHELGPEEYADALAEHRHAVRDAFAAHGGVEVDTQGDAFFYVFRSARAALEAARDGTRVLADRPIRIRIGLHTGAPLLTKEGYVGADVHLGARIAAAGHGGQVLLSAATRAHLESGTTDLGEHRLKDFADPVGIFQLGEERFPPLKTISNTNLPRPVSSFIGRERELAELVELVRGRRLVTLSGPGGSGKTRLALEAAAELVGEFKAGVFWVGLATIRDAALVLETIAKTVGARDGLAGWIGERELLLLLDNLEQVIDAAPQLADLLEACPSLHVLVTSRELLRVRGEVDYPVLPLAEPEAVVLFTTRARVEADETVVELCRRLDNLPLALELAAARAAVLSPAQILDRLSKRLDLFKAGRDADPRQQTLRATIEWSHSLLTDPEKQLFARLAVFRGGCTLDAAEIVAGAHLDDLQSLVDKSLLRHTGDRFWMLETIREYAGEQLDEPAIVSRHAGYYLALAEQAAPHATADDKEWLDKLDGEHDNLRAALDHFEAIDTQSALLLAGALRTFWVKRGHFREGGERVERLLAADASLTRGRASALHTAAVMAGNVGDVELMTKRAHEALAACRSLEDDWGVAFATYMCGAAAGEEEHFREAVRWTEEALERFRAVDDEYYALQAEMNLAYYLQILGQYDRARELLEQSVRGGNEVQQARALGQLAVGERQQGHPEEALAFLARALPTWSNFGDIAMMARDLRRLARVLVHMERADEAARILSASETLRDQVGHWESWIGQENDEILALIHAQLDDAAFDRAWAEGRTMSVEQALELARAG
jgi:predicted ATPase/class 3 adenylate cyclase